MSSRPGRPGSWAPRRVRTIGLALALAAMPGSVGTVRDAHGQSPAPSPIPSPEAGPAAIARLGYEVVSRRPHDTEAWTQGLVFDASGRLFESTGIREVSSVRELDPVSGAVLRSVPTPDGMYGEGLALVDDRTLIQLTWTEGIATVYDKASFAVLDRFRYEGEGWGLCHDGERLVMSDGSDTLTFRDPATFEVLGEVAVRAGAQPVVRLNELECVDGAVWSNIWETDLILRIDPRTGAVTGVLDTAGLLVPHPASERRGAFPNGIARIPGGDTWLLTGKLWPEAIEVRILEP